MVSPEYVLRGFPFEPSATCGYVYGSTAYVTVGLADGSVEVWQTAIYRPVFKSPGPIFRSKSPVLTMKIMSDNGDVLLVCESKLHELVFYKLFPDDRQLAVKFAEISFPDGAISPSFCQIDVLKNLIVRSGFDSTLILSTGLTHHSFVKNVDINPPEALGKLGSAMFVKLLSGGANSLRVRVVAGFEAGRIVMWSIEEKTAASTLLDSCELVTLFEKSSADRDDMDACPTCADALGPVEDCASRKVRSAFILIGSTSNAIIKLSLNEDMTTFSPSITRTPVKGVTAISLRADRKLAVIGFGDGTLCLIAPKSLSILGTLIHHRQPCFGSRSISGLDFIYTSASKYLLIASCRDKTLSVWDLYNEFSKEN